MRQNGKQIGYISRDDVIWVARVMDDGDEVKARIKTITGGKPGKPSYGVVIDINTTPDLGWEESEGKEERKVSVAHVREGKMYEGEVTSSEKEALEALAKSLGSVKDTLGRLSRAVGEEEETNKKNTRKGFNRCTSCFLV